MTSWSQWRRSRFWAEIVLAVLVGVAAFVATQAAPRRTRALAVLGDQLTAAGTCYPGTPHGLR